MTHRRFLPAFLPVAAFVALSTAPASLRADVAAPDAGTIELETRAERDARGVREVDSLRKRSITKISQLSGSSRSSVSAVVGTERAAELAEAAAKIAQASCPIDPASFIEPQFLVDPRFVVDPVFKSDTATARKRSAASLLLRRLNGAGIRTFAELRSRANRPKLESIAGAKLAGVLLSKASKAAQAGFIEPQFSVASSFLVGSDFIILHMPSPTTRTR
ncbi:MAG: hypothetical protein JRI23_30060 [Deltaproteobacteria bacterium]|jgi:hypothetical protein|nr:hypothetical protein [Deltaproteobacteria bacterium]MBW2536396.1 hypothetical protein [Deltaproteobacteria bacterium]